MHGNSVLEILAVAGHAYRLMEDIGVSCYRSGALCGIAREVVAAKDFTDVTEALAYGKLVDRLHGLGTIIPMRFGSVAASQADLLVLLKRRETEFLERLSSLDGCVEMSIRLAFLNDQAQASQGGETPSSPSLPGTSYLLRLREKHKPDGDLQHDLDRVEFAVRDLIREAWREIRNAPGEHIAHGYYLVPRCSVDVFLDRVERLGISGAACVTGPWTPWNFACRRNAV